MRVPSSNKFKFTKRLIEALPPAPEGKPWVTYYDDTAAGLALFVYPSGNKVFYFQKKVSGKTERVKIGPFIGTSARTIDQAREEATKIAAGLIGGVNPNEIKRELKGEPTFGEMLEWYIENKRIKKTGKPLSPRAVDDYRALARNHLGPILDIKMSRVTESRLKAIKFDSIAQNNRARAVISGVFSFANAQKRIKLPNPAAAIESVEIPPRDRFLQPSEMARFMRAAENNRLRDFWLLLLFTGARKSNVMAMAWDDIDLDEATWTIPAAESKNGLAMKIPLIGPALDVLNGRLAAGEVSPWVFPADSESGHIRSPFKAWRDLLAEAQLDDNLRVHDLRRSLGSWQARSGASLTIIGKSLGHKSHKSTEIYSHVDQGPVRDSMERAVANMVIEAKQPKADVIKLRRRGKG